MKAGLAFNETAFQDAIKTETIVSSECPPGVSPANIFLSLYREENVSHPIGKPPLSAKKISGLCLGCDGDVWLEEDDVEDCTEAPNGLFLLACEGCQRFVDWIEKEGIPFEAIAFAKAVNQVYDLLIEGDEDIDWDVVCDEDLFPPAYRGALSTQPQQGLGS